jgi:hypothetical protein
LDIVKHRITQALPRPPFWEAQVNAIIGDFFSAQIMVHEKRTYAAI